jgi:hypothetical protein
MKSMECWYLTSLLLPGSSPLMPIKSISSGESRSPLELAAGGYISVLDAAGGWTQVAARDEPSAAIPWGSRRQWRNLGMAEWRSQQRF